MNIFEQATKNKFRFPFRGVISTEDLYDLSLENLDSIYKTLNAKVNQAKEESLLNTKSKEETVIGIQIEIIKHIVAEKQAEKLAKVKAVENKQKKQKIMAILESKQESDLQNKSAEELTAMLNELE